MIIGGNGSDRLFRNHPKSARVEHSRDTISAPATYEPLDWARGERFSK
jgi:hypothetical protein